MLSGRRVGPFALRKHGLRVRFSAFIFSFSVLVAVGLPQSAQALELFGFCIVGTCNSTQVEQENRFIDPKRYDVKFLVEGTDGVGVSDEEEKRAERLRDVLKSASDLWQGREKPVGGSAGLVARAKGDYRRLLAALYNTGRYGGSISIQLEGEEAAEISPGRTLPERSDVTVVVTPGPFYQFGRADVVNAAPPPTDENDITKSFADVGFASGERAQATVVKRARLLAVEQWRQQGHALARVAGADATAQHDRDMLNVSIRMAPGPLSRYGDVTVDGAQRLDPDYLAYMVDLPRGGEFDPDDLERARARLDRLGVLASRKLEPRDALDSNGLLPISLTVQERKRRRIGVGATVSSVDGAGVEAYWLHRNLFGKAERLRLDAKFGGVGAADNLDQFDYSLGTTFTQPGFFTPDTDLVSNIFAKREFNDTFQETSAGGSIGVTHYQSKAVTLRAGVFGEYGEFEDAFGTRNFTTAGVDGEAELDFRDSKLNPTKGTYSRLLAKPFYEFDHGNAGIRAEAEARGYLSFTKTKSSILAGRIKLGSVAGPGIDDTPPDLLFTTGGGSSVRGYAFKSIGVQNNNGETIAGKSLLEGSVELRQQFTETLGAAAFVDAGIVGADSFVDFDENIRVGVGIGLRYFTGLGPIRLDVAMPLDPGPDDPDFAIYAGIGQAF